jgi:hypothetical protein
MAKACRPRRWLIVATLSLLACACGSTAADPTVLPSWIGTYPGSQPQAAGPAFVFETKDPGEKILDFYQRQLMQNGLHMEARGGGEYGGMLSAKDESSGRSVTIDIRSEKGASAVTITPAEKK